MKRKTLATILAALIALSVGFTTVAAAPLNNPHGEIIELTCESGVVEVVVTNGNPGHIIGSTQRLIPHEFTFGVVVDGEELFSENVTVGRGAKKGLQDRLITCTAEYAITDPDDLAEFQAYFDEWGIEIDVYEVDISSFIVVRAMPTGN
jgi:hypothetical protein